MSPGFGEKIRSPMARRVLGLLLAASILLVVYRYSPSDYLDYSAASSPPDQKRADDISKGWHMAGFGSSGK